MTTLFTTTNKTFPGMICSSTEFFNEGNETKIIQSGKILPFSELSFGTMQILDEAIHADKQINIELHDMHPTSKMKRLEQFAKCRFGGLDFQADIRDGVLQDGEYWPCPNHGNCASEGILCKLPKVNGERLTTQEIKLLQLTSTNLTNDVIGEEMKLPMGTLHKLKKNLWQKLKIQTKQEGVMVSFLLNLIQV